MTTLDLITKNVNGIGSQVKRISVFGWLKETMKCTKKFTLLQETHSVVETESKWCEEFGSDILFSHGSSSQSGVLIIPPKDHDFDVKRMYKDECGRILIVKAVKDSEHIIIANVYAPSGNENQKMVFAEELVKSIDSIMSISEHFNLAIGGDLNLCFSPELDSSSGKQTYPRYRSIIMSMLENYGLIDAWRVTHPETIQYTWRRTRPVQLSRIDYWLISTHMLYNLKTIDIKTSFKSDHSPVVISFENFVINKRGPGFWKFNSSLLLDEDYCAYMKGIICKYGDEYKDVQDKSLKWDLIKMEVRAHTISYSKTQAYWLREHERELTKRIQIIEENLNANSSNDTIARYKNLQYELEKIHDDRTNGILIRAKIKQIEYGDKNSKYFLNIEKNNYKTKNITKLITENNQVLTAQNEILSYEMTFYKNLLSTKFSNDSCERENETELFFNGITLKLLSEDNKLFCEKDLTMIECKKAIDSLPSDKSPGSDGLSSNFYKFFWDEIKVFVFESFQFSFDQGLLSIDQRRGVLSLNPKKEKDIRYLKHWRPLTLLNTDYKILAKAFGGRMRAVLPEIINLDQVAYLKERFIGQNIRVVDDVTTYAYENDQSGIILGSDFAKAFDSVEWSFIYRTMEAFGFGQNFIRWTRLMYSNISSCVTNNGYSSAYFKVTRGIRQGCPLSAYLFILVAEILATGIRQEKTITGFNIGTKEIRSVQMADDATLFLDGPLSLQRSLLLFRKFSIISGLCLNLSKSEALGLGKYNNLHKRKEKPYGLLWKEKYIKTLGIEYSIDPKETIKINFDKKLTKIQNLLNLWRPRNLTIKGKITVIKSIVLPQILYLSANLGIPEHFVKKVDTLIFHFLWGANMDKVKRKTIIGRIEQGGLKMVDIQSMIEAQRTMWVKRYFKQGLDAGWTYFLQYKTDYIFKIDVLSLFKCELHPESLCSNTWPLFYRQLLFSWFNLKYVTIDLDAWSIRRQSIVYNRHVRIRNKYARGIYISWFKAGIKQINDLYDRKGIPHSIETLRLRYALNIDIMSYCTIFDVIPMEWKRLLKGTTIEPRAISFEEIPHIKIAKSLTPISLMTNRKVYLTLVDSIVLPPVSLPYWEQILNNQNHESEWPKIYLIPYQISFDTRLHSFFYKMFLRIFPCNWYVSKFNNEVSNICELCSMNQIDDLCHYFYDCEISYNLWIEMNDFITTKIHSINREIILTKGYAMLGVHENIQDKNILNFIILYTKYYISLRKYNGNLPIRLPELLSFMKNQLNLNITVAKNQRKENYVLEMMHLYDVLN